VKLIHECRGGWSAQAERGLSLCVRRRGAATASNIAALIGILCEFATARHEVTDTSGLEQVSVADLKPTRCAIRLRSSKLLNLSYI